MYGNASTLRWVFPDHLVQVLQSMEGRAASVIALRFEPAVLCEPVSPAPLDGLPLADSTHTDAASRLCVPSTGGSAAGSGRKVLAVPHPLFAARRDARSER